MQIDITIILAVSTAVFAALTFYFARKKDFGDSTAQATTVIVELQTVRRDIGEMKADVQAMRAEWRQDHDKIVGMERDLKAMWKHIDKINGKDLSEE